MITPSFAPTVTERTLPSMALDFTTASLDSRVTVTRAGNTATRTNASGSLEVVNANLPRFDYNPTTLVCKGLLIEETRTNALVNSLIDGTNLATQSVTVTAAARTLSFYGTGQIVLSGTYSANVTGTGAYPTRTTLTFTPTAGTLTLTVTGTVQYAQLETGSFVTSFIPTDASAKTRNADVVTMSGTNFSSWFNGTQGSFFVQSDFPQTNNARMLDAWFNNTNNMTVFRSNATTIVNEIYATSSQSYLSFTRATNNKAVFGYAANNIGFSLNAGATKTTLTANIPAPTTLYIGSYGGGGSQINGTVQKIMYWPQRLTNNEIQAFSK